MGFAPAEVAAAVQELLAGRQLRAHEERDADGWLFELDEVAIRVGPLPPDRQTAALFHPRALLTLSGEGPLAETLKSAIRLKFLRVAG
jgi:hypothetical protein